MVWVLLCPAAHALDGNAQVRLAEQGRFDELANGLEKDEAARPLVTRDLHALCYAYSKTKRYNRLLPCLDRLEANAKKGDTRTRLFGLDDVTPTVNLMRAEADLELARYPLSIIEAQKALDWFARTRSDDKDIEINALALIIMAQKHGGSPDKAEEQLKRLEGVNVFWPYADYRNAKNFALARSYMALAKYDKTYSVMSSDAGFAIQAFLDNLFSGALLTGRSNWLWQQLPRGYMLNKALLETGRVAEARAGFDQLLSYPQIVENGEIAWMILFDRGGIAERESQAVPAAAFYARSIQIIEAQRSSINTEASKIGFVGDKQQVYSRLIALLFREKKFAEALQYIERARSRALVDMLAEKQDFAYKSASVSGLMKQRAAAAETAFAQDPMEMKADLKQAAFKPEAAATQALTRTLVVQKVEAELRDTTPELASLISVDVPTVAELQALLPEDEVAVEYYFGQDKLYAFIVKRLEVRAVELDAKGITDDVRVLRREMQDVGPVEAVTRRLYDRLIRPLEADLAGKSVLFVPHGVLHYLPFAALHDGREYLVEHTGYRVLPSLSVLRYLRRREVAAGNMLVFGNPDLKNAAHDLPKAQIEAESLGKSENATLLVRAAASETAFKKLAGQFTRIHLAMHGAFDEVAPLKSKLLFAQDSENDGNLTVSELYSLDLKADLVTLSACETGLGAIMSGDDIVGLTRGFLYAGASSIVASLWQVEDEATSILMMSFYAGLKTTGKRDALRRAQLETKKKFPHPFFWAPFYLSGNAQ